MEGKSLSKKAIVAIVIIAILVVAAISMVVVFLKDQGETEATAIGENNSNSEQTQDAVPENNGDNNDQGTATQSEEPQQEEQSEEQTTVANNDGATTNSGTTATTPTAPVQQTTTTTDGSTQVATTTTTETIPTQALTLAWSNMTVYGGELLANLDADVTDVTAPVRLATNILKDGESNDLREYYVKRGDTIYMYIAVNEELAHNPTFTLINNGTEYVMEDSLVTVRQSAENRWDYSVRYLIPEDTTFVDGEITLRVSNIEDVAGNSIPDENGPTNGHRVFYDGTAPEIHVKGTEGYMEEKENYVGNNEQDVYSKVSFKLSDNFKVVEYEVNDTLITGMTPSAWSDANFANIREFLVQGTNTITVRDIAGNESTYTFTYDSIAPVYSKLGILNKTRYVNKVEDLTWAKEGDEVRILISFPEKLAVEPTVKVFGKEYTATYRPASSNPEQNIYYYMVDFTLDETMPEGEIPFEVYGYADIAGNVGEKLEQTKINRDEYSKVIYDRTAPYSGNKDAGHPLYILNVSDANRRTWIKDGETLRVEANFNEDMDMSKAPILTIGTGKNVQTANFEYRSTVDGKRTFVADIVIDNNILGLADGTEVPFTVTNAFDLAGNEAILDNEDVTFTSEYGQVTYDNNAPVVKTVGMLNDTHYNEGKDTTVATTGDRIRLRVAFEEKLAVEPTVEVIGEDGTVTEVSCTYREQTSKPENNYYMYMADFTLTDEMNLPEGPIQVRISGYADAAGNVGEVVTEINEEAYPGVVYDTVAPELAAMGIFNWTNDNYGGDITLATRDEHIRLYVTFTEMLGVNPKVDIYGENGKVTTMDLAWSEAAQFYFVEFDTTDELQLPQGKIQFRIYGYEDVAGNVGKDITQEQTTSKEYPYVVFDTVAPEYTALGIVNGSHYDAKEGDIYHAKTGDYVRILVQFDNEKLAVMPKIRVLGADNKVVKEVNMIDAYLTSESMNTNAYSGQFTITEDMNLPEGEIKFEVYGYEDAAGNVGKTLTNADLKYPGIDQGVEYDKTAPTADFVEFTTTNKNNQYAKVGDQVWVKVRIKEELSKYPVIKINGMDTDKETIINDQNEAGTLYVAWLTMTEDIANEINEGKMSFEISGFEDLAGNVGDVITTTTNNTSVTFDKTAPALRELRVQNFYNPTGNQNYSGLTQNPRQNKGIAITVNTTELLDKNPIIVIGGKEIEVPVQEPQFNKYVVYVDITEDMNLVEGEKIPVTVKGLVDLAGNTGDEVTTTGNDNYYVIFDRTAPKTLANNILKLGESNEQREYYVRPGDSIYMCYTANEELGHNPTFTLINNGKEYVMEDSQVIVKQNPAKAWDYTVIYEIPEDTTFVDGEIELKVSNIEDKAGNKREDVKGPTNGHKVFFDTTAPEKLNLGIARNIDNGDTRDQRYAKAGDSIRVLVSFPEKLAVEPKVEMFGKVYDVTYRPDSSIEESNIYYYMADVKIDQNTPEGEVAFKVYGYKDVAGNEGEPLTNADINDGKYTNVIIDNTKPTIEPTEDSISGSEGNYSRIGFKVTDDNGVASYEINGETLILTNGEISYEALKSYLKEGVNTVVASDEAGNTAEYTFNYDAVAPTREYSNIMVNGDDSTKHEFYAKIGDKLWVSIGVKEELAHNPSFTLINNGVEYPMDGNLVKANYDEKNDRYSYVLIYEIPEDTAFVDGEITFKISDLVDLFGNKMTDETKPSNGNRVFFDKTPATIKLNGTEEPITIEAGSEYVDAGATVTDNIDGFISSNYQFTYANYYADPNSDKVTESRLTEIDTRKTGLYKIAYIYTDKAGNTKQATRYLYIKDTTMPTVTLNGEENITIEAGTPYKDEGAKVTDNSDPTIENFKYTNINYYVNGELKKSHLTEVDVKQPGEYKIGYEYTDKSGNTKITVRTVIVKDTTAPVITANGKSQTLKVGDTYTELGATLTDNAYIDADDYEITIHFYDENGKLVYPSPSKVDTSKVGEYRIAYTAKDSSGNASNVATISVKVER
ncbi:MAG: hypothetical protein BHV96_04745 [Clostridium sp. CAG:354_28_25]|nr:MAG: hypothetical protein BHV96_04745 [Clostridium sp. CAG:354_28_25]